MGYILFTFDSVEAQLSGWDEGEAFGTPSLGGDLQPSSWDEGEAWGVPSLQQIHFLAPQPGQGPYTGGTAFTFGASNISMTSLQDDFSGTTLDSSKWTAVTSGSGNVQVNDGTLQLRTGATAASTSRIRSVDTEAYQDIEITFGLSSVYGSPTTRHIRSTLGLFSNSSNLFRLVLETDQFGLAQIKLLGVVNGDTLIDVAFAGTVVPVGSNVKLRILRVLSRVLVFVGDNKIYETSWSPVNAHVEIGIENASSVTSYGTMSVSRYFRRPVLLFGTEPSTSISFFSDVRIDGLSPPGNVRQVTAVPISIVGASGIQTFGTGTAAWQYLLDPNLQPIHSAGSQQLIVTNDPIIRIPITIPH